MIVQACINGARKAAFHPRLPLTTEAMVRDSVECLQAGAAELHIHPRGPDGLESLASVDELMLALRGNAPARWSASRLAHGSKGAASATLARIAAWKTLPDYASVNLSEADAPAVMSILSRRGVGIEAGLATAADAERFVTLPATTGSSVS